MIAVRGRLLMFLGYYIDNSIRVTAVKFLKKATVKIRNIQSLSTIDEILKRWVSIPLFGRHNKSYPDKCKDPESERLSLLPSIDLRKSFYRS